MERPTTVLVTGCRHWEPMDLARRVCARLKARYGAADIMQGAAAGVDFAFVDAAYDAGLGVRSFPADWDRHGKRAGPLRNAEMVAERPDFCLAVHRDLAGSKGTLDCVRQCFAAGIPVYLLDAEDAEPRRITAADLRR